MNAQLAIKPVPMFANVRGTDVFVFGCVIVTLTLAVFAGLVHDKALWVPAGLTLATAILTSPKAGLYILVIAVAMDPADFDPLTQGFGDLFRPIPGLIATPVEIVAFMSLLSWVLHSRSGTWIFPAKSILTPALLLYLLLLLALLNGVLHGADAIVGLWEVRAFFIVLPMLLLVVGLTRTRADLYQLGGIFLLALILMSLELGWRYAAYIRPGDFTGSLETAFNHDGAVLIAFTAVCCIAWVIWNPTQGMQRRWVRLAGLLLAAIVSLILLASRRRAAVISAEAGIVMLLLMLLHTNQRQFALLTTVLVLGFTGYVGAFWNSSGALGQPARAFETIFQKERLSGRDISSDRYREIESYDIWQNIRQSPLEGIGFGVAYEKPIPLPDLSSFWPFWDYTPHNTILWLWMKAGAFSFFVFFILLSNACRQAIEVGRNAHDRIEVAFAASAFASFAMIITFSYVDLGLVSTRIMMLFGLSLGVVATLARGFQSDVVHEVEEASTALSISRRKRFT